ncbi:MAG: response regulator [Myxococcales bacterium]|nr:response regulator [Myxococcales bacterium]
MSNEFLVVAIGASAGGLQALEEFFSTIATDSRGSGAAYCVVQHLSPDFKSLMPKILGRHTNLTIEVAEDGMPIAAGHLYLNRADHHIVIEEGVFRFRPKERGVRFPIDLFLTSAAATFGDRVVATLLSGSGSDGSRGIAAVKAAGGQILVQDPESADFDGMPNAAIATGIVDGIGTPQELAHRLLATLRGDRGAADASAPRGASWPPRWFDAFDQILRLLHRHSGIDFGSYKAATLVRRVDRVLGLHQISLPDYLDLLHREPSLRDALLRDLLIGVTSFFRDSEVFGALDREIVPALLGARRPGDPLRLWVAGCATGEEAYSYAILLTEAFYRRGETPDFKILATDVDAAAIQVASAGVYSEASLRGLSSGERDRFFRSSPDGLQIRKELRERIVFSVHNLLTDPPFVRVDLVSMRNILIYLRPDAQRDALSSAAQALRPGGALVLGTSCNIGELADAFEAHDSRLRIYRRRADTMLRRGRVAPRHPFRPPDRDRPSGLRAVDELSRALLETYLPPLIVVDDELHVQYIHGDVSHLVEPPQGPLSTDLRLMARGAIGGALAPLLRQVRERGLPATIEGVPLADDDVVDITLKPLRSDQPRFAVELTWRRRDPERGETSTFSASELGRVVDLERRLVRKQEELQGFVEELETVNEELQATNEELIASNEELQSTNEELQATNEALFTVNAELERSNHDLIALSDDISNLLNTSDIATLFLDRELRIRRSTPALRELFTLESTDVGRPIAELESALDEPRERLVVLAGGVLQSHERHEDRVRDRSGRRYLRRIHPFVTETGEIDGVVLTFVDITGISAMAAELERHDLQAAAAFDLLQGVFYEIDPAEGRLRTRGDVASLFPGARAGEGIDLGELRARIFPDDRERAESLFDPAIAGVAPATVDFRITSADGGHRHIRGRGRVVQHADEARPWVTGVLLDVSEWVETQEELSQSRARLDMLIRNLPNGFVSVLDEHLVFREVYDSRLDELGLPPAEFRGRTLEAIYSPEHAAWIRGHLQLALDEDRIVSFENRFGSKTYLMSVMPLSAGADGVRQLLMLATDISAQRAAHQALLEAKNAAERANATRRAFLASMSHELRTPLAGMVGLLDLLDDQEMSEPTRAHLRQLGTLVAAQGRLIADLLDISRIDAEQLQLRYRRFPLAELLDGLPQRLADLRQEDVALEVVAPARDVTFVGDSQRLCQIIDNLAGNALKYTESGRVRVKAGVSEARELHLEVSDTGVGIPSAELEEIFELFTRGTDVRRRTEGAGLGLAISRRLVQQMDGTIEVESEVGVGSTFRVRIPSGPAAEASEGESVDARPVSLAGLRVLLVEDHEVIRLVVTELLRRDKMEVTEACDAESADAALAERDFDAVLMDIGLPDRSGLTVIEGYRANEPPGKRVPIIALTAYAYEEDVKRCLAAGADAHLAKPVDHASLRKALINLVPPPASSRVSASEGSAVA